MTDEILPHPLEVRTEEYAPDPDALAALVAGNGSTPDLDMTRMKPWKISALLKEDLSNQWLASGLLVADTYGQDAGELKTLKSYFGLARLVGLTGGVPILGQWKVPERQRALAFIAEGGRKPWTRRLNRMCAAHGLDPADLEDWLIPIFDHAPLDSTLFRGLLCHRLAEYKPGFVHLDPLYPFQPMTVSSSQLNQVGAMLTEVQQIVAEHDAIMWITAHMNQTGAGFDLKRITGAGVGEWGDSWVLMKHRETPDVDRGRFAIELSIGSRQWGGRTVWLDWNIGRFDTETGAHDGPITFNVSSPSGESINPNKAAPATLIVEAWRRRRDKEPYEPWTKTEWLKRAGGKLQVVGEEFELLVDDGRIRCTTGDRRKRGALFELVPDGGAAKQQDLFS